MTIVRAKEETMALQDTIILLLQCIRFVENKKKSVILGMLTNSKERTISLPQKKIKISKKDRPGSVSDFNKNSFKIKKRIRSLDINNSGQTSSKPRCMSTNLYTCQQTYFSSLSKGKDI